MSFHSKTLLGSGSAPGTRLTLDEEKATERKLKMLTADPINAVFEDNEFKMFKTKQFERAFPGKQPLDATGRGIDMPPVVRNVEPFKPTLRRDDLDLSGSVGEEARNRPAEVIKVKKALSNTGLFDFDVTREKSTDAGPMLRDATRAFQRLNGIEADGCIKPNCPTHKALKAQFFPEGSTNSKATPVDLRPAAMRAEASAAAGTGSPLLAQAGTQPPAAGGGASGPTFLAQAKTPRQPGAPIGSGIKKPGGLIKWPSIVTRLLQREGGFNSNDPSNRGVKDTTLKDHLRRKGTPPRNRQDLLRTLGNLTEAEAREVYDDIVARSKVDQIPDAGLAEQVFDGVVNHGSKNGVKQLQRALIAIMGPQGANFDDGFIGPRTLAVLLAATGQGRLRQIRDAVVRERKRFIGGDVKNTLIRRNSLKPPNLRRTQAEIIAVINVLTTRAEIFRP